MSSRNTLEAKRVRRNRRTLQKGRLPAHIDLIEWIKMRSNLSTLRARNVILNGSLRVDSHKIGYKEIDGRKILDPIVPAELRGRIQIVMPEHLRDG